MKALNLGIFVVFQGRLPKTSKSHYSIVNADHMGTVNESMEEVALWIKAL